MNMNKSILKYLLCVLIFNSFSANCYDELYDRYKKAGVAAYNEGNYTEAIKQFNLITEIPCYETDPFANNQIKIANSLILKRQMVKDNLTTNEDLSLKTAQEILKSNPTDNISKVLIFSYLKNNADVNFKKGKHELAKNYYQKSLEFTLDNKEIYANIAKIDAELKIEKNNLEDKNKQPIVTQANPAKTEIINKPAETQPIIKNAELLAKKEEVPKKEVEKPITTTPKSTPAIATYKKTSPLPKLLFGIVTLGGAALSLSSKNGYATKLSDFESFSNSISSSGSEIIGNENFNKWKTEYDKVISAKKSAESKIVLGLGIAAAGLVTEVILLARKPKNKIISNLQIRSANEYLGLCLALNINRN